MNCLQQEQQAQNPLRHDIRRRVQTAPSARERNATCAFSAEAFDELLNSEVEVEMERLRAAAVHGVPARVRGDVWKYLLGVTSSRRHPAANSSNAAVTSPECQPLEPLQVGANNDMSSRMATASESGCSGDVGRSLLLSDGGGGPEEENPMSSSCVELTRDGVTDAGMTAISTAVIQDEFDALRLSGGGTLLKRVRAEMSRYQARHASELDSSWWMLCEQVLGVYLSRCSTTSSMALSLASAPKQLVAVVAPFTCCLRDTSDVYFALSSLLEQMSAAHMDEADVLARFAMLFRSLEAELCTHFEDEELALNEWAVRWLRFLLAPELPPLCILRLWDTYFSEPRGLELHMFVCLALLRHFKVTLLELEYPALKSFLTRIPHDVDVAQILALARNIKNHVEHLDGASEAISYSYHPHSRS